MDNTYTLGLYTYKAGFEQNENIPKQLMGSNLSAGAVLLELLIGKSIIFNKKNILVFESTINYSKLPATNDTTDLLMQFSEVLGVDLEKESSRELCDNYFRRDRRNGYVYERVLNEFSQYFIVSEISPCEGFVHLYRILEYMSYSFPMIYAAKSKNYKGSYDSMKKFFLGGDNAGELKFLGYFLKELFDDEPTTYEFEFEILVESDNIDELRRDFEEAVKMDIFTFENNTLEIKFKNIKDIFVEIRNKYFHMLLGKGNDNFIGIDYCINDLFRSLNPIFVNWISCIFVKIIQYGISQVDS